MGCRWAAAAERARLRRWPLFRRAGHGGVAPDLVFCKAGNPTLEARACKQHAAPRLLCCADPESDDWSSSGEEGEVMPKKKQRATPAAAAAAANGGGAKPAALIPKKQPAGKRDVAFDDMGSDSEDDVPLMQRKPVAPAQ